MSSTQVLSPGLIKTVLIRGIGVYLILAGAFFLPAGTLDYWQAWVWLLMIFIPMLYILAYLVKHNPDLLERRMRLNEKEKSQRKIIKTSLIPILLIFLIPGFDKRYGFSYVPVFLVIASEIITLIGYGIIFLVFRENRYASRVVEVEKDQKVITTGPYSVVRHPMYVGTILMYTFSPLALGSWVAVIPAVLFLPLLVARIKNEETVLVRDLKGYKEYMEKVRYRLFPGMW